jgi:hypothetical protein
MTTPREPGWYDDPQDPKAQRYWDGNDWTPNRQRKAAAAPVTSTPPPPPTPSAPPPPSTPSAPPPTASAPPPPPPSTLPPPAASAASPNVPPPSPSAQPVPPAAARAKFRVSKRALVLAGLALVLAIAALVAGRVKFGSFLPGILIVAAIATIGVIFTLRSHQSVLRKASVIAAMVLVVAAAIPASEKGVYPAYAHFFKQESPQASRAGSTDSGSTAQGPSSGSTAQGPSSGSRSQAPKPTSGLLVESGGGGNTADFGFIDPTTGKYTEVASFPNASAPGDADALELSPDLTKLAVIKTEGTTGASSQMRAGWIDTSGNFTAVSPAAPPAADFARSTPPIYSRPVFDGAGNFYYLSQEGTTTHLYKLSAGSTSNPQEVTPTPKNAGYAVRNFDGTLQFGCNPLPGMWLGSDSLVKVTTNIGLPTSPPVGSGSQGFVIAKYPVAQREGCPTMNQDNQSAVSIFDAGLQNISQPVSNPGGTKLAFLNTNSPGGLYVVGVASGSTPNRIAAISELNLPNMKLVRWI